jgi:hypothetical protein
MAGSFVCTVEVSYMKIVYGKEPLYQIVKLCRIQRMSSPAQSVSSSLRVVKKATTGLKEIVGCCECSEKRCVLIQSKAWKREKKSFLYQ